MYSLSLSKTMLHFKYVRNSEANRQPDTVSLMPMSHLLSTLYVSRAL